MKSFSRLLRAGFPIRIHLCSHCPAKSQTESTDSGRPKSERLARYFDTSQFRLSEQGQFGNAGRNILNGPGVANFNLSLHKSFPVRERQRVEFRTELFNAFNRASLGNPSANLNNQTNFGRITAAGAGRIMQLALRYEF